jgi:hypothetical protein
MDWLFKLPSYRHGLPRPRRLSSSGARGEGFSDNQLRIKIQRWPLYLLAWFLPLIAVSIIVLLAYAFNLSLPDYSLMRGYIDLTGAPPPAGFQFMHLLLLFVVMTPLLAPILLGQEFGWRGYLQPRLFPQRPQLSALGTGILWALWYLPFYLAGCFPMVLPPPGITICFSLQMPSCSPSFSAGCKHAPAACGRLPWLTPCSDLRQRPGNGTLWRRAKLYLAQLRRYLIFNPSRCD